MRFEDSNLFTSNEGQSKINFFKPREKSNVMHCIFNRKIPITIENACVKKVETLFVNGPSDPCHLQYFYTQ